MKKCGWQEQEDRGLAVQRWVWESAEGNRAGLLAHPDQQTPGWTADAGRHTVLVYLHRAPDQP